jgi:eukaryotic-like serine/threonine-protein kinase
VQQGAEQLAGVQVGEVLAGKYRVERVLGVGGMGVVVAAYHMDLETRVALKLLLPEMLRAPGAVARFLREAKAAVKIESEHVARVLDVGSLPSGAPYTVMEFLEGGDLAAWLQQRGPLPIEQAIDFVLQACVGAAEAHGLGIVHRDLKPANLFCVRRSDGQLLIKVLDFGISKVADVSGGPGLSGTRTGSVMGSPLYMSPEQMRSSKDVNVQTDIWAFGVVLFELLTGRTPFVGETLTEVAVQVVTDPAPPVRSLRPDVPAGLEAVIRRCLEKDWRLRYPNVAELAVALLEFGPHRAKAWVERISGILQAAGLSASALDRPPSPQPGPATMLAHETVAPVGRTAGRPDRRVRPALLVSALVGIAAVAVVGFAIVSQRASSPSANPQPASSAPGMAASPPPTAIEVPKEVLTAEPSLPTPSEGQAVSGAHSAATSRAPPIVAPVPVKMKAPIAQTPSRPSQPAQAVVPSREPAPVCTVATDYDSEGQPHFKKVCK